ncbi:hypothetical protein E2C01_034855 [Portunus trituberculatus]|uniref:Uncharacterized protein n=1 Tax=Portunus trituberculatus TaxID=210409 RepID=A0A5B7F6U5_PORTR|nr:hypothetical protein [Portunus trituberculatus]
MLLSVRELLAMRERHTTTEIYMASINSKLPLSYSSHLFLFLHAPPLPPSDAPPSPSSHLTPPVTLTPLGQLSPPAPSLSLSLTPPSPPIASLPSLPLCSPLSLLPWGSLQGLGRRRFSPLVTRSRGGSSRGPLLPCLHVYLDTLATFAVSSRVSSLTLTHPHRYLLSPSLDTSIVPLSFSSSSLNPDGQTRPLVTPV